MAEDPSHALHRRYYDSHYRRYPAVCKYCGVLDLSDQNPGTEASSYRYCRECGGQRVLSITTFHPDQAEAIAKGEVEYDELREYMKGNLEYHELFEGTRAEDVTFKPRQSPADLDVEPGYFE